MRQSTAIHPGNPVSILVFICVRKKAEKLHLITELYFSSQGQKDEQVTGQGNTVLGHTVTTLNAVNLPFLFEFGRVVTFQLGPQIGFLVSGREKGTVSNSMVDEDLKSIMRKMDVGLVLGLGIHPTKNLNLGARYNFGLTPVFNTPQTAPADWPAIHNLVLHFYVGWSF
jgi:hypothetical protein